MELLTAWVLFPLVGLVLALGVGLLVERAGGLVLPGVLVLPVGLGGLLALAQLTTWQNATAEATIPLFIVLAVAGLTLGRARLRWREVDPWAVAPALGVFCVFAAPVVLSGSATFAGYTVLGDTSIHFLGADELLRVGRDAGALAPSGTKVAFEAYFQSAGYPSGGPATVGALTSIVHQDVAWTFQPFLSLLAGLSALALYQLATEAVTARPWRVVAAFLAAQPALVLAYALQGSVKEVGTVFAVVTVAALISPTVRPPGLGQGWRAAVPLAVASAAAASVVGAAAVVWLGPLLLVVVVAGARASPGGWRALLPAVGAFCLLLALFCASTLAGLQNYVRVAGGVVTAQAEFGNLLRPLENIQAFGIWLANDYRQPTAHSYETLALIGVAAVAAIFGLAFLVRRRAWALGAFVGTSLLAWWYVTSKGSPWADGKALMIVSPAVVLCAALGAFSVWRAGRQVEGCLLAGLLALGILGSNALAYHHVALAPRARLAELEQVGHRIAGRGPTLSTEFEEFSKHFLRAGDVDAAQEVYSAFGRQPAAGRPGPRYPWATDLDDLAAADVLRYRTLVTRRGPAQSRPSSAYRLVWHGRYYNMWERTRPAQSVIEHLPVGAGPEGAARPACQEVRGLAHRARAASARLAVAERSPTVVIRTSHGVLPAGWAVDTDNPDGVASNGPGRLEVRFRVPRAGRYHLWVELSTQRDMAFRVDGRLVGTLAHALNGRGAQQQVDDAPVQIGVGYHRLTVDRPGGNLAPGNGYGGRLGPVTLVAAAPEQVRDLAPADYRQACGTTVDWVEAVSGGARPRVDGP